MPDLFVQEDARDNQTMDGLDEPPMPASPGRAERLAAWLQFPRRVAVLLVAFGLMSGLLVGLRSIVVTPVIPAISPLCPKLGLGELASVSWSARCRPVSEIIGPMLPNTLLLLGAGLFLALCLALAALLIALLVHKLEKSAGLLGSVLKGLGRLFIFAQAAAPALVLGTFLILVFAIQLKLLPYGGMAAPGGGDLAERVKRLVLPALTLALLPATLTAQVVARELTLSREKTGIRLVIAGVLKGIGVLLGQIGGWLSATVLVELVFAWPGLGRALVNSIVNRDYPMVFGALSAYAGLVLAGRLMAELLSWLARIALLPIPPLQFDATPWRRTAKRIWLALALLLLLIPLVFFVTGLTVDSKVAITHDVKARNIAPSAEHPWGTDSLGRDVRARVLFGGMITLGVAVLIAIVAFVPGLLGGALAGWLASFRVLWSESLADVLLFPAEMLLFIPALPGAMVLMMIGLSSRSSSVWIMAPLVALIVLLPRLVRMYSTLWVAAPQQRGGLIRGVAGTGALLVGALFAGFALTTALGYVGLGFVLPPVPTLGGVLADAAIALRARPEGVIASGIAIWLCAFVFYTAADALVGFFNGKEPLARLNE